MNDITAIIRAEAIDAGLPWELVQAICQVESSLNPWAMRYEPNYRWFVGRSDAMSATEKAGQQISWGLMQVMGAVAREHGFTGWFPQLCEPVVGLRYGLRHLLRFHDRYQSWHDAIASYNAGSPIKLESGRYKNQHYVDEVMRAWNALEFMVPIKESEA